MKHIVTEKMIEEYREHLIEEEKSIATIKKYTSDIRKLMMYAEGREITKKLMVEYKEDLRINKGYKLSSINSFIIAANRFFQFMEWYGLHVKVFRIQKEAFVPEKMDLSMQEYRKLVDTARSKGKKRLAMIIQTLCATGIRISELVFLTVESVERGEIEIYCKKKHRKALIPKRLRKILIKYIKENNIKSGVVFRTSRGNAVDRSNIWREMKALKEDAKIAGEKIFPHNLRHLFAKVFYNTGKDISKLADVLGHSSIGTTRCYIMTTSEEHRRMLDRMGIV